MAVVGSVVMMVVIGSPVVQVIFVWRFLLIFWEEGLLCSLMMIVFIGSPVVMQHDSDSEF